MRSLLYFVAVHHDEPMGTGPSRAAPPEVNPYLVYSNLGELRGTLGVFLERLANAYGLTANKPLVWIFPSTPVEQMKDRERASGEVYREIYLEGPNDEEPAR